MIYLQLFLSFLKIGAFSFGGGMGMISLLRETVITQGWMSEEELMNFIAVSESTPGPIAVNMATFVGASQAGFMGGLLATLGVVLPSFVIILLIASVFANFAKQRLVQGIMLGVRPAIIGLIAATTITMGLTTLFSITSIESIAEINWQGIVILIILIAISIGCKIIWKKKLAPISIIIISAILGIVLYS